MNLAHTLAVLRARNREFLRDRSSLAWNILLPVLAVAAFAVVFSGAHTALYKVGVVGGGAHHDSAFLNTDYVQFIPLSDLPAAIVKVERHQIDLLFDPAAGRYWINDTSPKGYILERVLRGSDGAGLQKQTVSGREIRYVDWVAPGVLAINMMFSALFGVGYVIVRYRKSRVLRRLKATPLTPLEFLSAQVLSRLWLIVGIISLVFAGTNYFIGFSMFGSYLNLFIVLVLGAACLISLGLLIAARTASEELAGGLLNVASWPMMMLSGAWFSLEGSPGWVQKLAQIFPLTHVIDAARAIMIDGAGLAGIAGHLLILATMTAVFLALGALLFRWE